MKTLSLSQPWASLVASGAKRIETRSWRTDYRGPLAIHAAKGFPVWAKDACIQEPFASALARAGTGALSELPLGSVLAVVRLVDCQRITADRLPAEPERSFGDYTPGRLAWILHGVDRFPAPVPAKGALGVWEWQTPTWQPGQRVRVPALDVAGTVKPLRATVDSATRPYSVMFDDMRDGEWGGRFWGHELEAL